MGNYLKTDGFAKLVRKKITGIMGGGGGGGGIVMPTNIHVERLQFLIF